MLLTTRKAFTMMELIFVIVVIGILSAVAIPKLAVNRDDALIAKAKTTVSAIRNAVASERQKRILRGDFTSIYKLSGVSGTNQPVFDAFDGNRSNSVLQYPVQSCAISTSTGCWRETTTGSVNSPIGEYTYNMPVSGSVIFELKNNRFDCKDLSDINCIRLTR